jgi:hypothetical protein
MSRVDWVLAVGRFAGLVGAGLLIGWTVRDRLHMRAEHRARREHERIAFGAAPDDDQHGRDHD